MQILIDCTTPEAAALAGFFSGFVTCALIHFFTVDLPNRKARKEEAERIKEEYKNSRGDFE